MCGSPSTNKCHGNYAILFSINNLVYGLGVQSMPSLLTPMNLLLILKGVPMSLKTFTKFCCGIDVLTRFLLPHCFLQFNDKGSIYESHLLFTHERSENLLQWLPNEIARMSSWNPIVYTIPIYNISRKMTTLDCPCSSQICWRWSGGKKPTRKMPMDC